MPFYTGTTADGSDMVEAQGMYISPCGRYFSNMPYPTGSMFDTAPRKRGYNPPNKKRGKYKGK